MVLLVRKSEVVACKQGADQLAHQCTLVSTFFIYCLVNKMAIHEILNSFKMGFFFNVKKFLKVAVHACLRNDFRDMLEVWLKCFWKI